VAHGGHDLDAFGLGAVAARAVPGHEDRAHEAPLLIALVGAGHRYRDLGAVGGPEVHLLLGDGPDRAQVSRGMPAVVPERSAVGATALEGVGRRSAHEVGHRMAGELGGGAVRGAETTVGVEDEDGVGQEVDVHHESPITGNVDGRPRSRGQPPPPRR
jgi:hypothetical protein